MRCELCGEVVVRDLLVGHGHDVHEVPASLGRAVAIGRDPTLRACLSTRNPGGQFRHEDVHEDVDLDVVEPGVQLGLRRPLGVRHHAGQQASVEIPRDPQLVRQRVVAADAPGQGPQVAELDAEERLAGAVAQVGPTGLLGAHGLELRHGLVKGHGHGPPPIAEVHHPTVVQPGARSPRVPGAVAPQALAAVGCRSSAAIASAHTEMSDQGRKSP